MHTFWQLSGFFNCQAYLNVEKIVEEHGFLKLRDEPLKVINKTNKILHYIDLKQYDYMLEIVKTSIDGFESKFKEKNITPILLNNLRKLQIQIRSLIPHNRQKRGALNIIGSGLKFIAGTMDDEDRQEIINHLRNIDFNNRNLIEQSNKQVRLNEQFHLELGSIISQLNINQNVTSYLYNNLTKEFNDIKLEHLKLIEKLQIESNMNLIRTQVEKIKENIMLSRLEVLGRDLLSEKEIIDNNINQETLKYLRSSVIYKNRFIIFIVSIPTFSEKKYYKIYVQPVPNSDGFQIVLDKKVFITDNSKIYEYNQEILLYESKLEETKNKCIKNIFHTNKFCAVEKMDEEEIDVINDGLLILKNMKNASIIQNCNDIDYTVYKNNLIRFSNCFIQINNIKFSNEFYTFKELLTLPNNYKSENITFNEGILLLKNLKQENFTNIKEIKYVKTMQIVNHSLNILSLIAIIFIAIIVFTLLKKNRIVKEKENIQLNVIPTTISTETVESREGGVTGSSFPPYNFS